MEMLPQQHAHHTCNQHTHELHTVPASTKSCLSAFKADLRTDAGILASPHHCAGPARPHCSLPCWCVCVSASASSPTQSVPGRTAPHHHCFPQTLRGGVAPSLSHLSPHGGCLWRPHLSPPSCPVASLIAPPTRPLPLTLR